MEPVTGLDVIINIFAIVLSLTAILLTIIGFFASLRFYRDGVGLQTQVKELLSRVDEKVASVQSQVGGMFAKTLDAAIGRSSPQAAAEDQRRLMKAADEKGAGSGQQASEGVPTAQTAGPDENLASKVMDYFAFKKMRYTDVSTGDARAVFMLGAGHGFNLFDGLPGIVFFGYFHQLEPRNVVARVRFLLNNISAAYKRIETAAPDQREVARKFLDQIKIEVLVPDATNKEQLAAAITKYQASNQRVDVTLIKPSALLEAVEMEYQGMGLS